VDNNGRQRLDTIAALEHTRYACDLTSDRGVETMRGSFSVISFIAVLLVGSEVFSGEPGITVHLDSPADRRAVEVAPQLFSLPPEQSWATYKSESIVYLPGEKAHITVEIPSGGGAPDGEIAFLSLISGSTRALYRGPLSPGTYGPYEAAITADFEVYEVRVRAGGKTLTRGFYGIRPWRGMKNFSEEVSAHGVFLGYQKPAPWRFKRTTPWDMAVKEKAVPLDALDANWALASHVGKASSIREKWWLWTHYACGMVGLQDDHTGLFWGEYNPWILPIHAKLKEQQNAPLAKQESSIGLPSYLAATLTDGILPNGIYFRERIQPVLRKWAEKLSDRISDLAFASPQSPFRNRQSAKHPNERLRISLGDDWSVGRGIGRGFGPETLRYFVFWMNQQFGIAIQADTFKELIQKCRQYPKHFEYFVARNTTLRSLELTCEAVRDIMPGSKAWSKNGESNRQLIALPEAAEFCEILSRCIGVGTSDDRFAFRLANGNPLPYSMSNMVFKAFAPDHNFCVGWSGCPQNLTDGEIYRWYLEPAWITAYDMDGKIRHLYTHSPPTGVDGVWRSLIEDACAPDEKIQVHDKCFQLMEAIGVEKPTGPVFVCKDWTFADDKSGSAFRPDLYEKFLISLRRQKVPISSAVHADHESALPADLPRLYAPRMSGEDEIRFGFRAGSVEKWFTCAASGIPDSLIGDLAVQLNSASGNSIVFPPGSSIEGYGFEAKGMKFVVAEEVADRKEKGEIKIKVGDARWKVIDIIAAKPVPSRKEGEYVIFEASLQPNSATLYCLVQRRQE